MPPRLDQIEPGHSCSNFVFSWGGSQREGCIDLDEGISPCANRMRKHAYQAHFDGKIYQWEHICLVSIISRVPSMVVMDCIVSCVQNKMDCEIFWCFDNPLCSITLKAAFTRVPHHLNCLSRWVQSPCRLPDDGPNLFLGYQLPKRAWYKKIYQWEHICLVSIISRVPSMVVMDCMVSCVQNKMDCEIFWCFDNPLCSITESSIHPRAPSSELPITMGPVTLLVTRRWAEFVSWLPVA